MRAIFFLVLVLCGISLEQVPNCDNINGRFSNCVGNNIFVSKQCQVNSSTRRLSYCEPCTEFYEPWEQCHCAEITVPYGIQHCLPECVNYLACESKVSFDGSVCTTEKQAFSQCSRKPLPQFPQLPQQFPTEEKLPTIEKEILFTQGPYPYVHVCTIVETSMGDIVAVFQSGPSESNVAQGIWFSRRNSQTSTWSTPEIVVQFPGVCTMNPSLYQNSAGVLFLMFHYGGSFSGNGNCLTTNWKGAYIISTDEGKTWQNNSVNYLPENILGSVKNKCILTSDRNVLCPSSEEGYINNTIQFWRSHVEITDENFTSWKRSNMIMFNYANGNVCPFTGVIQPTLMEISPGKIIAYLRSGCGVIAQSISNDGGFTFEPIASPTQFLNPNSGIDSILMKDEASLGMLLTFNNDTEHRYPLNLVQSTNLGNSWTNLGNIDEDPLPQSSKYEYPSLIQSHLKTNVAHVCYTYTGQRSNYKRTLAYSKLTF